MSENLKTEKGKERFEKSVEQLTKDLIEIAKTEKKVYPLISLLDRISTFIVLSLYTNS